MDKIIIFILFSAISFGEVIVLDCHFDKSATPNGVTKDQLHFSIHYDSVSQKSYMAGNNGINNLNIIQSEGKDSYISFIETTVTGNLSTTSIYIDKNGMNAVHSRHMHFSDMLMFSQLYGHCELQ